MGRMLTTMRWMSRMVLPGVLLLTTAPGVVWAASTHTGNLHTASGRRSLAFTGPQRNILLVGPYAEAHVLVEEHQGDTVRDVSDRVTWQLADACIATVQDGVLRPTKDGKTVLTVHLQQEIAQIPVEVRGIARPAAPCFLTDVLPVLTKEGCNQGACHGAGSGKGGFKLSLRGYDPDWDYDAITRANGARRICRAEPEESLLLWKPTFRVRHRGGRLFAVGAPSYRLLKDWIAAGLPAPSPTEPQVKRLEVIPATRTLPIGLTQRYQVLAHYSDKTVRDVTGQTIFTGSDAAVASVTPGGVATVAGKGEAAVLVRYQGLVTTAHIVSPFATPRVAKATAVRNPDTTTAASHIDALIAAKLDALGLSPSGICNDSDFLRRVFLDVIGVLPTPKEARAFLADHDPKKREKLIDALLERPEYVDYWTLQWADLLHCSRDILTDRGMYALNHWIRRSVATNKPWDQFARELLLAHGDTYATGPANFFRASGTPETLAETTSQLFLGVRIQCARCHNHPYEKWTQNQYYQMAAFFARVRTKPGQDPNDRVVFASDSGEENHPKTHRSVVPTALDATPVPPTFQGDRRQALVEWLVAPQNPFFSHILVNRLWHHYMGRGFVEPVDDLRVTNPPSNAALFDWLSDDFARHGYDLKYLMRSILRSQSYQRAADSTGGNGRDDRYYSHFLVKRLGAEQLQDALTAATGVATKFDGYPLGVRAAELPDTTNASYLLDLFGRPARMTTCTCERGDAPNLGQVLHMMNGKDINDRVSGKTGLIATLTATKLPDNRMIEELYLTTYSRFPLPQESRRAQKVFLASKDKQAAAQDLLWALLNSNEFLFNH